MKTVFSLLALVLVMPLLLLGAIALGPVILGLLCAVGFGAIVFFLVDLVLGLGLMAEIAGSRLAHRLRAPSRHD